MCRALGHSQVAWIHPCSQQGSKWKVKEWREDKIIVSCAKCQVGVSKEELKERNQTLEATGVFPREDGAGVFE